MKSLRGWFMTKRLLRIKYSLWEYKYVQSIQYNTATRCHKYHICSALNVKLGHPVLQTACCLHFISLACTQLSAPHLLITGHKLKLWPSHSWGLRRGAELSLLRCTRFKQLLGRNITASPPTNCAVHKICFLYSIFTRWKQNNRWRIYNFYWISTAPSCSKILP